jgi:hypothetical protein
MKLDMANLNIQIGHDKLTTLKLDTPNPKIGYNKPKTFTLDTSNLEIGHGKLRIPQIKHHVLKKWAL